MTRAEEINIRIMNNVSICIFMNISLNEDGRYYLKEHEYELSDIISFGTHKGGNISIDGVVYHDYRDCELKYHMSWDWLTPVIERIEKMGYRVDIISLHSVRQRCLIYNKKGKNIIGCSGDNKFETTYRAVTQFIEWYNKQ